MHQIKYDVPIFRCQENILFYYAISANRSHNIFYQENNK